MLACRLRAGSEGSSKFAGAVILHGAERSQSAGCSTTACSTHQGPSAKRISETVRPSVRCAQETVACFVDLLAMGADMDGSPANERLTRQVQQFTTVRGRAVVGLAASTWQRHR